MIQTRDASDAGADFRRLRIFVSEGWRDFLLQQPDGEPQLQQDSLLVSFRQTNRPARKTMPATKAIPNMYCSIMPPGSFVHLHRRWEFYVFLESFRQS
jgi:hypothetical protein